jgi:hypothetical protein
MLFDGQAAYEIVSKLSCDHGTAKTGEFTDPIILTVSDIKVSRFQMLKDSFAVSRATRSQSDHTLDRTILARSVLVSFRFARDPLAIVRT